MLKIFPSLPTLLSTLYFLVSFVEYNSFYHYCVSLSSCYDFEFLKDIFEITMSIPGKEVVLSA